MWTLQKWHLGEKSARRLFPPLGFVAQTSTLFLNYMFHDGFHNKYPKRINVTFIRLWRVVLFEKPYELGFSYLRAWICGCICVLFHLCLEEPSCSTDTHTAQRLFNTTQQKASGQVSISYIFHKGVIYTSKKEKKKLWLPYWLHIWAPGEPSKQFFVL